MLLEKQIVENDAILAIWHITETQDELLDLIHCDPFVIQEISAFTSEKRKLEYLAVRAMLNEVLGEKKTIAYEPSGKPYLTDHSYEISITHTGCYAAIILHPTCHLGIDIERMSDKVIRVQSKFLSLTEREHLDAGVERTHLTMLWSAKEALYKIAQQREIDFAKDLAVEPCQLCLSGSAKAHHKNDDYVVNYRIFPEFVLAWIVK